MGTRARLSAGACLILASAACGGIVKSNGLDADGGVAGSGVAGSGVVPPVGGASGVGAGGTGTGGGGETGGASGAGGTGTAGAAGSIGFGHCGKVLCSPGDFFGELLPVCCAEPRHDQPVASRCGLQTRAFSGSQFEFRAECEPKHQPGDPDERCGALAVSVGDSVYLQPGCCRTEVGVCGFQMDYVGRAAASLEFGCVSATVSRLPRPVAMCGQGPRPHYLSCECFDGTKHEFCLVAGCDSGMDQHGVCAQACGGWDNRRGEHCSDNDPRCG